jgi:hypothetical protein
MSDRKTNFVPAPADAVAVPCAVTTIEIGKMCFTDASGYLTQVVANAVRFFGVADDHVVNAGSAGDVKATVRTAGRFLFTSSGLTQANLGDPVYLGANSYTVTVTPGTLFVGRIAEFVSSTSAWVTIDTALATSAVGNYFTIGGQVSGAVGSASTLLADWESPVGFKVLRGYATCTTAPGNGKTLTVTITDGTHAKTLTIVGTATKGENESINQSYAADTNINITAGDVDGSTADLSVWFDCVVE